MRDMSSAVATTLAAVFIAALAWILAHFATFGLAFVLVVLPAPFALFLLYFGLETHAPAFLGKAERRPPVAPTTSQPPSRLTSAAPRVAPAR
jgi:hypothetical protein